MHIIEPKVELEHIDEDSMERIERAARTCYRSDRAPDGNAEKMVRFLIQRGHESQLEHAGMTLRITCDRGITHELVRHRIGFSYSQESTRYCNYSNGRFGNSISVIEPSSIVEGSNEWLLWESACHTAERHYLQMLGAGCTPNTARSVLPTCTAAQIVVTGNWRAWRNFLRLRAAAQAHPDMQVIALKVREIIDEKMPVMAEEL